MGNMQYTIIRNGEEIEAGYGVKTVCEKPDCDTRIDRGLAYLCGETPGGDERGCGGYFCGRHLTGGQQCEPCDKAATAAATWTNPETGEEFDLRQDYLPPGEHYRPDGWVWRHLGGFRDEVPVLVPVELPDGNPGGHWGCVITEYEYEDAAVVAARQRGAEGGEPQ